MTSIRVGRRFLAGTRLFFSSLQRPTDSRSTFLLSGCKGLCNFGTLVDHSFQFSVEVKNRWDCTSTAVSLSVVVFWRSTRNTLRLPVYCADKETLRVTGQSTVSKERVYMWGPFVWSSSILNPLLITCLTFWDVNCLPLALFHYHHVALTLWRVTTPIVVVPHR